MAACAGCKRGITPADAKLAVMEVHDVNGHIWRGAPGSQMPAPCGECGRTGKIVAMYHYRCNFVESKRERIGIGGAAVSGGSPERGRYYGNTPSVYEMSQGRGRLTRADMSEEELERRARAEEAYAALKIRQREIAAQRELEEVPESFTDWRDPETMDLDELIGEIERREVELGEDRTSS